MNQRVSGILLHPTSLSNPYPIGDLGPAATAFADFMVKSGQRCWQILPIGPTEEENSPYQSSSALGGNPLLVSPDRLVEQGFLDRQDIKLPNYGGEGKVNYPAAARLKLRWLKKAFEHFEKNRDGGWQSEFDALVREDSFWLEDFSMFSAIQGKEGTSDWTRRSQELRTRQPDAIIRVQKYFANDIRYHQFVQWQFSVQWQELKAYCTSHGIGLIGDIPLFVAHQSADVWAHPGLFKLDANGKPTVVAESLPITSPKPSRCGVSPCIAGRRCKSSTTTGGSNACGWLLDGSMLIGWVISSDLSATLKCLHKPRRL